MMGEKNLDLLMDPEILEEILVGLLKNAIENTPDEGLIRVDFGTESPVDTTQGSGFRHRDHAMKTRGTFLTDSFIPLIPNSIPPKSLMTLVQAVKASTFFG